jgi:hypothetical protein
LDFTKNIYAKNNYLLPLEKIQELKYGELQKCSDCNTIWYMDKDDIYSDLVEADRMETISEWNKRNLAIKPTFLKVLLEIGNTPPPIYGDILKNHICIPCKCTLDSGLIIDYCILNIQRKPPLHQKNYKNIIYIDQVIKIEPSEFSLPLNVRIETTKQGYYENVDEYNPTIIEDTNGVLYYIDYGISFFNEKKGFFNEKKVKGAEMKIRSYTSENATTNPKFKKNKIIETQIIADWTIELEKLFI